MVACTCGMYVHVCLHVRLHVRTYICLCVHACTDVCVCVYIRGVVMLSLSGSCCCINSSLVRIYIHESIEVVNAIWKVQPSEILLFSLQRVEFIPKFHS